MSDDSYMIPIQWSLKSLHVIPLKFLFSQFAPLVRLLDGFSSLVSYSRCEHSSLKALDGNVQEATVLEKSIYLNLVGGLDQIDLTNLLYAMHLVTTSILRCLIFQHRF